MEHVATTPKKEPKFARKYFLTKAQIRMLTKAAERAGSDRSAMLGIMIEYCDEVFRIGDTKKGAAIMAANHAVWIRMIIPWGGPADRRPAPGRFERRSGAAARR